MIFVGDIAIPNRNYISFIGLPPELKKKFWFGNLEGSLIKNSQDYLRDTVVFNDFDAVRTLKEELNFVGFNLANNHLLDVADFETTSSNLKELSARYVGAGQNLSEARQELLLTDTNDEKYCILSFGWEAIKCIYAKSNKQGVNPYIKKNVLSEVYRAINLYPDRKLITYFHWNYELELYPQPYDRDFAKQLIDIGVYSVIGCHAHRVQPIEFYRGRPIVYGLGNFLFPQNVFWNGKLKFPEFTYKSLAFEIVDNNVFKAHWLSYNPTTHEVSYVHSEIIEEGAEFENQALYPLESTKDYELFFKKNRYHKKMLPVFRAYESEISVNVKISWVKIRGMLIDMLLKNRTLFNFIRGIFKQ